ncbi:uncharacterized protein PAC_12045 [Phialocephala subalpina]|uniref:Uncharacterized protein n=1 Tax=Phialocephala subalpina TaxID=576137 RepID=A0A1L7XAT7_9HELO|nr:uncharacterized protein PAC_12045 [Phialocephala subalpina]
MPVEVLYAGTGPEGNLRPTIDIVAVHGLNPTNRDDHPVATWTDSKSGHLWLRDALPNSEPSARVLVYSYNSSPAFGNDKDRFIFQANYFLECLRLIRRKDTNLPLIMIGHSLGGILIKQALINAQNNPKYTDIKQATFGLMFFGTPHSGPTDDLKVKFGRACVKIAQSLPWKVSNDIMEALKKGSLFSDVLSEHWRHQLEQYQIVSFYEGIGNCEKLVPRESAVLGLDGRRENQVKLDATHENMCRFNPFVKKDTDNYFLVEGNIADLCSKRPEKRWEFIKSLGVWSYNPRLEKISDKHRQSLQWIWNDHEDGPGFVKWLRSDVPIYWITGLPGSGKSTLMKYLYENPQTKNYISTNGGTVTAIGYFFHDLGVDKETRFESLLASILEALSASSSTLASLYATYFLDLKKRLKSGPRHSPWHERHLRKALELIGQSDTFGNILLFVDGLDECSGDHRKQLEFLVPWIQSTQGKRLTIRMCLSSRPLPKIRLRLSTFPECRVHEWTANDISAYVRDRLNKTWNGLALSNQKPRTHFKGTLINYLTNTVIGKAQGIFLWVELVVNNLIVGMEEGSSDIELRECLDSLPPELEDLYARIFKQIPKDYIHDATIYFMLAVMRRSIGLLDFFLATRDPEEALARKIQSSYEDHLTMKYACARAETRIESRCRGLLQVKQNEEYKTTSHYTPSETEDITPLVSVMGKNVEFLHLSVRDYIASRVFATSSPSELGVDIAFMARSIGLLKLLRPDQLFQYRFGADEEFPPLMEYMEASNCIESPFSGFRPIEEFFLYAWFPANSPRSYQRRLLSELDQVCSLAYKDWHSAYLESALEDFDGETPVTVSSDCWNTDIFCLCLAHGLYTYVREEIGVYGYKPEDRTGRPLLHFFFDLCYTQNRIPNLDILRLLLRRGAKPNEVFDDKTS